MVEITSNQVRKAAGPTNEVNQKEEQGSKSFYSWKSHTSEDDILEEEGNTQTSFDFIFNFAIILVNSSLMKPDMRDPGITAISQV